MLTAKDIRQLADKDLARELLKAKGLLAKQLVGLRTRHLKDSHTAGQLKQFIARLLTVQSERARSGAAVAESAKEAAAKLEQATAKVEASQTPKKKAAKAKKAESETTAES